MIKQKLKRALNGLLAAVMCVSTLTAVSYVQPTTASADNGNVYYNPALRWLQYDTDRVSTILVANALVTQGPMHCFNENCPSNAAGGYYKEPYLNNNVGYTDDSGEKHTFPLANRLKIYNDSDSSPDINMKHFFDTISDDALIKGVVTYGDGTVDSDWGIARSMQERIAELIEKDSYSDIHDIKAAMRYIYDDKEYLALQRFSVSKAWTMHYAAHPKWYWIAETGEWTYARAVWDLHTVTKWSADGKDSWEEEEWYISGYNHDGLTGDNTGTSYSRTQMTVYRVPEYTKDGTSGYLLDYTTNTNIDPLDTARLNSSDYIVGYGVAYDNNTEGYIDRKYGMMHTDDAPKIASPRTALKDEDGNVVLDADGNKIYGQYTGRHFTATYCQACGIWNASDPGIDDRVLNNGNWNLNPCTMFDTKEGLSVKSEVTRTYGYGVHEGKNAAGDATNDNDILYHRSLDNQQTRACMYCFGTQKNIGTESSINWVSLNKEEDMYLFNEHEYYDWGIKTEVSSPYTLTITKTCNGDAIADFGCGYTETNIYEAKQFVNDYIGVVDGTAHYPQGALAEASLSNKDGTEGVIEGDADGKILTATLEWKKVDKDTGEVTWDSDAPMRIIAGTDTNEYKITYSFPEDYIDNKTGELTNSAKDADDNDNRYVGDVTTSVTGVATVTLTPTNMSYSNEGNKNYYNNNNASGNSSGILSGLYGNLIANGWNGNVVTGGTTVATGGSGSVIATSSLIDGYSYIIDTDAGIGTYAAYQPSSLDVPDPLNNGNTLHGVFIETGTCNMRGSYNGSSDISHACQYMYSNNGIDYWECIYCNHWLPIQTDSTIVYVHSHTYYKIDEIPATCVAQGKVYRKCVCGDIIIEDTPIDHSNHTGLAHVVSPAATCENDGYEYDKCTGCGAEMNGKMIPKLGHQWSIVGTTKGYGHNSSYVTQECSRCNKLQTISSNGTVTSGGTISGTGSTVSTSSDHTTHEYVIKYIEVEGDNEYTVSQCTVCGDIKRDLTTAGDHTWIYMYDETEGDNTYKVWQCDDCGRLKRELVSANGHHYEYKYTENDCTTGTYEIWQCTGCGEIERRMTAAASGHVWVEQSGGRESTCNINGFRNYICSKCGLTKLEMLPLDPNNHQHVSEVLDPAPTCTEAGRSYERCLDCGTNISNTYLAPLGHDYKELLDSDPTCFDKGYNVKQCSRCYEVVTVEKPQLDHHYVETGIVNESQCTVDGLKELECEYCKTKKYESVVKTGHTPGAAPTCTEDQTCTVCGAVLAKATGHNYVSNVVAPTCTTMGYTKHRCSVCGDTYVDTYTDTINHDYRVVSTIAPTCTSMGYKVYKCSVCGDEYKADYTDVLAHRYRADVTRPTCVESGYTTYTCMDCGTSYVGDITEPDGHTYRETTVAGNCADDVMFRLRVNML